MNCNTERYYHDTEVMKMDTEINSSVFKMGLFIIYRNVPNQFLSAASVLGMRIKTEMVSQRISFHVLTAATVVRHSKQSIIHVYIIVY